MFEKSDKDISYLSQMEESLYNLAIIVGVSGTTAAILILVHIILAHQTIPIYIILVAIVSALMAIYAKFKKYKVFNEADGLILQRLKRLELFIKKHFKGVLDAI
jgi:hypothetical protein